MKNRQFDTEKLAASIKVLVKAPDCVIQRFVKTFV